MQAVPFGQIIIAGGDEDVTSSELIVWIAPLLAGIPGGRWMSCQLDFGPGGEMLARLREGNGRSLEIALAGPQDFLGHLPEAQSLTMIMLDDFSSQAVTLLDGIARWLNIYETGAREVAPVVQMLSACARSMVAA